MERKNKLKSILILFMLLFSSIFIFNVDRSEAWWDEDFDRYQEITLTNAIAGYQTRFNVTYDDDMQTDFDDIRFVDDDDTTELDYWIEYKVDSDYAIVWVELLDAGDTIYMYYGNAIASSTSNASNTWNYWLDWTVDHTGDFTDLMCTDRYEIEYDELDTSFNSTNGFRFMSYVATTTRTLNNFGTGIYWGLLDATGECFSASSDNVFSYTQVDTDYTPDQFHRLGVTKNSAVTSAIDYYLPDIDAYEVWDMKVSSDLLVNLTVYDEKSDGEIKVDAYVETNIPTNDLIVLGYGSNFGSADGGHDNFWLYDDANDAIQWGAYNTNRCILKCKNKWIAIGMYSTTEPTGSFGAEQEFGGPANNPPVISNPIPIDVATGISQNLYELSIDISDPDVDLMNWTIECSNGESSSGNNDADGTYTLELSPLLYNTTYTWYVNVTDGGDWTNETFNFTTELQYIILSNEAPTDSSTGVNLTYNFIYNYSMDLDDNGVLDIDDAYNISDYFGETGPPGWIRQDVNNDGHISASDISYWLLYSSEFLELGFAIAVDVNHLTNATCNATFYTNASGVWEKIGYEALLNNETANCTMFDNVSWNTKYWWSVNVTDDAGNWTNATYNFTTAFQEFSIPYSNPNNTLLTPDQCPEYFQVNVTSLVPTDVTVHFMTNISGNWEEFDTEYKAPLYAQLGTTYNHTLISRNISWCQFNKNIFWSANITSFGLWYNETFNFTTDRCYQIMSYDEVYEIDPIIKDVTYGDISEETNAIDVEDALILNLNSNDITNQISSIEVYYSNSLSTTTLKSFRIRCCSSNQLIDPVFYINLYINGQLAGNSDNARMVSLNSHRTSPVWDPDYNPGWDLYEFGNAMSYIEWYDIDLEVSGHLVFEIVRDPVYTVASDYYIYFFPAIKARENIHESGPIWVSEDEPYTINDGLLKNTKIWTSVNAPNGIWDGAFPHTHLAPGAMYTAFRLREWFSYDGPSPFDWLISIEPWYTDAGVLYSFSTQTITTIGERILPDTSPKNNSYFTEPNPNLECYILTNIQNFTINMDPVFVSVKTNASDGINWVEIWNNTGNYSELFPSEGTFNINSSQYNFSFDQAGTRYYWRVCSRKLSNGAEWANRTFNFWLIPVIANFTYTKITENSIQFNSTSIGNIDYYAWDFGDGSYAYAKNPKHYFHGYGDTTVTLCVENDATGYTDCYSLTFSVGVSTEATETSGPYGYLNFDFVFPFIYVIIMLIILMWFMRGLDQFEEDVFE